MPFGLKNAPSEFQKRMEDIFGGVEYVIVYIDDLLVFSKDVNTHKKHLENFYEMVYKHGLVLSHTEEKFQIGKVRIDYLGLHIERGNIELQPHVLLHLLKLPDTLLDKKMLQRFLGCLNYIRQFYEKQSEDTNILEKRLKKEKIGWSDEMTTAVRNIKSKIRELPRLRLPVTNLPFILETDASDHTWAAALLQKHGKKELVCAYASGSFNITEVKYPSSHKEILAVKRGIQRFRLFLKSVRFLVRIDLKHMKSILANKKLLEQGNTRILRWALWLEGFDFDIVYKSGDENYLADMLTREGAPEIKDIKMFRGESSSHKSPVQSSVCQSKSFSISICSQCKWELCWDCFVLRIKSLPVEVIQIILQKWFDSENGMVAYLSESPYRDRPWRVYYSLSREPIPICFGFIQHTDWTWQDYFSIHQRARIQGYVRIIAYATQLDGGNNWWSPWFKLFLFKYMPRSEHICNFNFRETISTLMWEIHIAARYDYTVEFEFLHSETEVALLDRQQDEPSFSVKVRFHGEISTDPRTRPANVFHFPFFCCFLEVAPPWLDDSLPRHIFTPDIDQFLEINHADSVDSDDWQYNSD